MSRQDGKVFIGGLSWETTDEKLRRYFENYGTVQEAFVSYDRHTGRPRGFGFVVFADPVIADKVVAQQHTIDRREVEAKKALPKDESPVSKDLQAAASGQRTKKIFVGGLAASVDEAAFRGYFEDFGTVEDAVVMYDHDNRRPRGFGFITFSEEEAVDKVFGRGTIQTIHEKQIEIKRAVPRDSMPPSPRAVYRPPHHHYEGRSPYQQQQQSGRYSAPRGERERSYGPPGYSGGGGGVRGPRSDGGGHRSPMAGGSDRGMYSPGPAIVTGIPATMATTPGAEGAIPTSAGGGVITPPPGMAGPGGMMGVGQPQSPLPMSQGMQPSSPLVGTFALQNGMQGAATTPGGQQQFSPTYGRDAQQAQQAARNLADLQQQVTLTSVSALEQLQVQQVQAQQAQQQAPSTIWS